MVHPAGFHPTRPTANRQAASSPRQWSPPDDDRQEVYESTRFGQEEVGHNPLLYPAYEAQRKINKGAWAAASLGLSMQMAANAWATVWGFPQPLAEFNQEVLQATKEVGDRVVKDYEKPSFEISKVKIAGQEVGVTEEVVKSKAFGDLIHFKRDTDRNDPKLLIVAPMSGHYATLLKGTVERMLPEHDVYITDWKNAREVPLTEGDFGLDDYISYVKDFVETVGEGCHLLAVCQPTVPTLAAVSRLAQEDSPVQPLSMTLMGGPVDVREAASQVTELAEGQPIDFFEKNFIAEVPGNYPGAGRKVYPGFLQLASFMSMNMGRHVSSHLDMWNDKIQGRHEKAAKGEEFYDEYLAVADLPARFYLETVQEVFQEEDLADGEMKHFGKAVDPSSIRNTALFTVEGSRDDIAPPGQTTAAHDICSGLKEDQKYHYLQEGAGHYGIFSGRRWRDEIAPRVTAFIRNAAAKAGLDYDPAETRVEPKRYTA